jgi:hypothetical protein
MSRVYETVAVLILLAILICGLAYILSALLDSDKAGRKAFFGEYFFNRSDVGAVVFFLCICVSHLATQAFDCVSFTDLGETIRYDQFGRFLRVNDVDTDAID